MVDRGAACQMRLVIGGYPSGSGHAESGRAAAVVRYTRLARLI